MSSSTPSAPLPPPPPPPRLFARSGGAPAGLRVVGGGGWSWRDAYHALLRTTWTRLFGVVALGFLVVNALFGAAYWLVGGVANAEPTFWAHFFFSVHTFGTIGYGSMYPQSPAAEVLMTLESLISLILNAVVTGLTFAKFARPTSRLLWSKVAVVSDRDGVPTLMFRVANERMNHVVEATLRLAVVRSELTSEGERIRRVHDLALVRASSPTFVLTWTAMHQIVPGSPLYGVDLSDPRQSAFELVVTLTGLDDTLGQTIHSRTSYVQGEVVPGARFADIIVPASEPGGQGTLDYGRFHDTLPAPLTWERLGVSRAAVVKH